jgi:hypothetical protein
VDTSYGAAIRLDAELMSQGPQRQSDLAFAAWSGGPVRLAGLTRRAFTVPPTEGWSATRAQPGDFPHGDAAAALSAASGADRPPSVITRSASQRAG